MLSLLLRYRSICIRLIRGERRKKIKGAIRERLFPNLEYIYISLYLIVLKIIFDERERFIIFFQMFLANFLFQYIYIYRNIIIRL